MTGEDRRRHDDKFKAEMLCFMSRIDQRNIDKDLAYAVQGDVVADHEERLSSLEHSRTQLKTVGLAASSGFGIWLMNKLGIHF
jgi:hypothetical protein